MIIFLGTQQWCRPKVVVSSSMVYECSETFPSKDHRADIFGFGGVAQVVSFWKLTTTRDPM